MTQGWWAAELELGTGGTKQTPKGQGQLTAIPEYLAVPLLCKPNPTHFLKVFEKDYSGGGGKKGGFVTVNLSSLNFLRSYSIFILIEKSISADLGAGTIRGGSFHGWLTTGWRRPSCSWVWQDALAPMISYSWGAVVKVGGFWSAWCQQTLHPDLSVGWSPLKTATKASGVGLNRPSPPQKPLLRTLNDT